MHHLPAQLGKNIRRAKGYRRPGGSSVFSNGICSIDQHCSIPGAMLGDNRSQRKGCSTQELSAAEWSADKWLENDVGNSTVKTFEGSKTGL